MIGDQALTVADLSSENGGRSDHVDDVDDHSTLGFVDHEDDDSFLANSSLCRQHRSTIQMLDSLRKEVVEIARSDGTYLTPQKSPQDVMIHLNSSTIELASPLTSPLLSRTIMPVSTQNTLVPALSNHRITPLKSRTGQVRSDDSTFCSMDRSINNEMNKLREVVKDLQKELKAENLDSVFEAIERIGKSDDPKISSIFESEDKEVIREGIRSEMLNNKATFLGRLLVEIVDFPLSIEIGSMHIKILIASIVFRFILKCISS
jgi:hypothetical protein